ncbi:hypothetical protein L596_013949 [Steinernema carpocapsae]|uniref:FLYWCH-type domain-containing protein n=1 Tax=Steinernema carpocapsae TaxID=34508 RepID=A0A4U5NB72_STECR|nr:hypothetical protein L596_013949 [Steinernema carpocapsae]
MEPIRIENLKNGNVRNLSDNSEFELFCPGFYRCVIEGCKAKLRIWDNAEIAPYVLGQHHHQSEPDVEDAEGLIDQEAR